MNKTLAFLISAGIFFCTCTTEDYPDMFDLDTFDKQMAAWKALGITSYQFTAKIDVNYPSYSPAAVTVRPDAEPEVIFDGTTPYGQTTESPFPGFEGVTIDDLFASIGRNAANKPTKESKIMIRYNEEYHYPEAYGVYYKERSPGLGFEFEITHFEVLEDGE